MALVVDRPDRDARQDEADAAGLLAGLVDVHVEGVDVEGRAGQGAEFRVVEVRQGRVDRLGSSGRLRQRGSRLDALDEHRLADVERGDGRFDGRAEGHDDRPSPAFGPFPEEAALGEAHDAPPDVVEVDRDHRHLLSFGEDDFQASLEGARHPGPGELSFGEDPQGLAVVERLPAGLDRLPEGFRARVGHRDQAATSGQVSDDRPGEDVGVHQRGPSARDGGRQEEPVVPGDVVRGQQDRPGPRHVLQADPLEVVPEKEHHPQERLDDPGQGPDEQGEQQDDHPQHDRDRPDRGVLGRGEDQRQGSVKVLHESSSARGTGTGRTRGGRRPAHPPRRARVGSCRRRRSAT